MRFRTPITIRRRRNWCRRLSSIAPATALSFGRETVRSIFRTCKWSPVPIIDARCVREDVAERKTSRNPSKPRERRAWRPPVNCLNATTKMSSRSNVKPAVREPHVGQEVSHM